MDIKIENLIKDILREDASSERRKIEAVPRTKMDRKNVKYVGRKNDADPKTTDLQTRQQEVKNKVLDEGIKDKLSRAAKVGAVVGALGSHAGKVYDVGNVATHQNDPAMAAATIAAYAHPASRALQAAPSALKVTPANKGENEFERQKKYPKKPIKKESEMRLGTSSTIDLMEKILEIIEKKNKKEDDKEEISGGKTEVDTEPETKTASTDMEQDDDEEKNKKKKKKVEEELKGNQHKLDKNKNGKIDADDFKKLRKEEVEQLDEVGDTEAGRKKLMDYTDKARKQIMSKETPESQKYKRTIGMHQAASAYVKGAKKANEEVENINEISIKRVVDYQKTVFAQNRAEKEKRKKSQSFPDAMDGTKYTPSQKDKKRQFGSGLASDKLTGDARIPATEEVEQIDELSQDTIKSFALKSMLKKHKAHADWKQKEKERDDAQAAFLQHHRKYKGKETPESNKKKDELGQKEKEAQERMNAAYKTNKKYKGYMAKAASKIKEDDDFGFSEEELNHINSIIGEDAVASAQKAADAKMKAANIKAKATIQADKIKDQANKQAKMNNSAELEGNPLIEASKKAISKIVKNPAAPFNDAVKGVKSSDAAGPTHLSDETEVK